MEKFSVVYKLKGSESEAYAKALDICYEQTVEFPQELVPDGFIRDEIVGSIESFGPDGENCFEAEISFGADTASGELPQLLNVIFGNISIKPGIRVMRLNIPESMHRHFKGPRFGIEGIRRLLGVKDRPLLFTALKPMGLSSAGLADLAYRFALGGIDIIKDDHGIINQKFSPFEERTALCAEAVEKANRETGRRSIYVPNITSSFGSILDRARYAKESGAGGLLISPGLIGFDVLRELASDDRLGLPLFSHPAFLGSYVFGDNGISHGALLGQINRIAGADAVIYPNFGGRFSFSREECQSIAEACVSGMGDLKPIFPCPAGGMSLVSIPESLRVYGQDVIFLVGGGLFQHGPDLVENSRYFLELVSNSVESRN